MAISPPRPRHEQHNLSKLYNALIHEQDIQALETFGEFGEFGDVATQLYTARQERGTPGVLSLIKSWTNRKQPAPEIKRALVCIASGPMSSAPETQSPKQEPTIEVTHDEQLFPPLPEELIVTPDMTRGLCPLKDEYVAYSKQMSPEGYEDFHPSCFWGMLSMVAGRRIAINLRRKQYTALNIMLSARSTLFAKTETAEVQRDVLKAASLEWMLGLTRTTPQKLLKDMSGSLEEEDYGSLNHDAKQMLKRRLAMSGQRGWHYNEFGKLIKAMMRSSGPMADFVEILLQISDCPDELPSGTIARGSETVMKPYIAITGTLTPASLKSVATKNTELWSDGFFARFVFSCPPRDAWKDNPYERGQIQVPGTLSNGIRDWHDRLGEPLLDIIPIFDDEGKDTGKVEKLWQKDLPETLYNISDQAYDAWKRYRSVLKRMPSQFPNTDLDGSYGRLNIMALRIAALAASIDNASQIEYEHWLLGQEQAEMWRAGLHQVYIQVNSDDEVSGPGPRLEDKVLEYVEKLQSELPPSARDIARRMHMETLKIEPVLQSLVRNGALEKIPGRQSPRYKLAGEEEE